MANFNQQMNGVQQGMIGQIPSQPSLSFPYGTNNSNFNYFNSGLNNSMNLQGQYQFLKCRPVSSKEEARAAQIKFLCVYQMFKRQGLYIKYISPINTIIRKEMVKL